MGRLRSVDDVQWNKLLVARARASARRVCRLEATLSILVGCHFVPLHYPIDPRITQSSRCEATPFTKAHGRSYTPYSCSLAEMVQLNGEAAGTRPTKARFAMN